MIDFKEFLIKCAVVLNELESDTATFVTNAFKQFDKDGDGYISKEELESVLTKLTGEKHSKEEIEDILNQVDANGDGKITLEGELILVFF